MLKRLLIISILVLPFQYVESQSDAHLNAINKVWEQFYLAFETLDYQPMAAIHSKELIRISGGERILDYSTYISNYKLQFEQSRRNQITNQISLRFFERIATDSVASERGIYRLIRNKGKIDEVSYYGQFHVILKNINGEWKITMDYDSSEHNTIGKEDYEKAYAITDFTPFIKQ